MCSARALRHRVMTTKIVIICDSGLPRSSTLKIHPAAKPTDKDQILGTKEGVILRGGRRTTNQGSLVGTGMATPGSSGTPAPCHRQSPSASSATYHHPPAPPYGAQSYCHTGPPHHLSDTTTNLPLAPPPRPLSVPSVSSSSHQDRPLEHEGIRSGSGKSPYNGPPLIDDELTRHFPEIGNMCKEDLQDLLNDPDYFRAIFVRLPQVKQIMETHQALIVANQSLAEKNLSLRPQLESLRDQTVAAFTRTNELKSEFERLSQKQAELYTPFKESAARARLLTALHESDKVAENLASQFVDEGTLEEDQFVRRYREERIKYHKRAWVANRWTEASILV